MHWNWYENWKWWQIRWFESEVGKSSYSPYQQSFLKFLPFPLDLCQHFSNTNVWSVKVHVLWMWTVSNFAIFWKEKWTNFFGYKLIFFLFSQVPLNSKHLRIQLATIFVQFAEHFRLIFKMIQCCDGYLWEQRRCWSRKTISETR